MISLSWTRPGGRKQQLGLVERLRVQSSIQQLCNHVVHSIARLEKILKFDVIIPLPILVKLNLSAMHNPLNNRHIMPRFLLEPLPNSPHGFAPPDSSLANNCRSCEWATERLTNNLPGRLCSMIQMNGLIPSFKGEADIGELCGGNMGEVHNVL